MCWILDFCMFLYDREWIFLWRYAVKIEFLWCGWIGCWCYFQRLTWNQLMVIWVNMNWLSGVWNNLRRKLCIGLKGRWMFMIKIMMGSFHSLSMSHLVGYIIQVNVFATYLQHILLCIDVCMSILICFWAIYLKFIPVLSRTASGGFALIRVLCKIIFSTIRADMLPIYWTKIAWRIGYGCSL